MDIVDVMDKMDNRTSHPPRYVHIVYSVHIPENWANSSGFNCLFWVESPSSDADSRNSDHPMCSGAYSIW